MSISSCLYNRLAKAKTFKIQFVATCVLPVKTKMQMSYKGIGPFEGYYFFQQDIQLVSYLPNLSSDFAAFISAAGLLLFFFLQKPQSVFNSPFKMRSNKQNKINIVLYYKTDFSQNDNIVVAEISASYTGWSIVHYKRFGKYLFYKTKFPKITLFLSFFIVIIFRVFNFFE